MHRDQGDEVSLKIDNISFYQTMELSINSMTNLSHVLSVKTKNFKWLPYDEEMTEINILGIFRKIYSCSQYNSKKRNRQISQVKL